MSKKAWALVALFVLVGAVVLSACTGGETIVEVTRVVTETEVVEGEPEVVEVTRVVEGEAETIEVTRVVEVEVEAVDEEEATRRGGWLDTIVFVREPDENSAVARLLAGDLDMYPSGLPGAASSQAARDSGTVTLVPSYGLYYEIFFNVGQCTDESVMNPFTNAKIREAMNWAIDRDYIASEIYAGTAVPKYTAFSEAGVDRGNFAPEVRSIEAKYAYNLEHAREVITAEMEGMGAELVNGVWSYNGEPINLVFLIRNEVATRNQKGHYVANQLEDLGFQIERRDGGASDLGALWVSSDPVDCLWHLYTGGWSQTAISRNDASSFNQMYLPEGYPVPAWQVFDVPDEMRDIITRLVNNDFVDLEERAELFRTVLPMTLEQSYRIWVVSQITPIPYNDDVQVTSDLAAGISGAALWSRTVRFADQVGGSMTVGVQNMFVEPWNPIGGSNWVFDAIVQNAVSELAVYFDPNLGTGIPNRVESAALEVTEGTAININPSTEWVTLDFVPEVVVPDDAWVDWDAANQVFLTAAEVYTETQTAVIKSTVTYPAGFDGLTWHDGSPFTAADIVTAMITVFDLAKEDSPYYDPAAVPGFDQFMTSFKGVRILSADPLVIETYTDAPALDAENSVSTWWTYDISYPYGDGAFQNMAVALRLEANGATAFTPEKAEASEVERISFLSGPSLAMMAEELALAAEEGFIPYEATLGQFITADEVAERYANLTEFARRYGHYYLGTGPYFFSGVFPVEQQAVLSQNAAHPDLASRYDVFSAAPTPIIEIDGDTRVTIGQDASFDVYIDYFLGPYAVDDIKQVSYLLFDSTGAQVALGQAEAVEDGLWQIVLDGEATSALSEGSSRVEVVVVSNLIAMPGLASHEFVVSP